MLNNLNEERCELVSNFILNEYESRKARMPEC